MSCRRLVGSGVTNMIGFVPAAPLLVTEIAGGSAGRDVALREACRDVARVLASGSESIAVMAAAGPAAAWDQDASWDFTGFGVPRPGCFDQRLPWQLGIGAWLLDQVGYDGGRRYVSVAAHESAPGADIGLSRLSVLMIGDGSARRSEKAPGYLDDRAASFDATIAAALATGDIDSLASLDPQLTDDLLCSGAPAWRGLGVLLSGYEVDRAELLHDSADYGVGYFAALWVTRQAVAARRD